MRHTIINSHFSERDFMSFWLQVYCAWSRDAYCSQSSVSNLTKHCGFYGPYKPTLTCDTYRMIDFMWMNVGFFFAKSKVDFAEDHFFRPWFDVLLFAAFGLGGNLRSLYHVSAKVGVHQLTVNDLTDENKLLLCNKVLDDLDEGLECFAQVFVRECYMLSDVERES